MIKHMLLTCCVVISAYTLYFSSPAYASTPGSSSSSGGPHSSTSTVDADYHYEPVSGKIIGVWPDEWTVQRLRQLRLEYGFSGVVIYESPDQYTNALQAGFSPANIMVLTSNDSYIFAVDNLPAGIYYLDEPAEHNCSGQPSGGRLYTPQELATRRDYIHANRPGAKFVIGGYKRCNHNLIASTYADLFMYSSYMNWDELGIPLCFLNIGWGNTAESPWLPGNDDQRDSWTAVRQSYGSKFMITWIHGGGDEYSTLFPHANQLGLNGLWQFNRAPIDSARLESFCATAWENGWLARVPNVPLPIQLASFTATVTADNGVSLRWVTLSEINNYGFEIQCRTDSQFITLPNSFIPGHGTTIEPHEYSYVDASPASGRSWYRLKQIDLDGSVHLSHEVSVDLPTDIEEQQLPDHMDLFQNYPNPFNPATRIVYGVNSREFIELRVFDVLGREVATLVDETKEPGSYTVTLDAANLASGVYVYMLRGGSTVLMKKLMVLR